MKRSGPPQRLTPLTVTKGLDARTELKRTEFGRSVPLPRQATAPRKPATKTPKSSDKGTAIPRDLAAYILDRAEGCCDWCGRYCLNSWYSRQHRDSRGMGGRAGAHTAANLVLLCGSATSPGCHERCERSAIPEAQAAGFRLKPGEDPEQVPILRHGRDLVYPTAQGWVSAS